MILYNILNLKNNTTNNLLRNKKEAINQEKIVNSSAKFEI